MVRGGVVGVARRGKWARCGERDRRKGIGQPEQNTTGRECWLRGEGRGEVDTSGGNTDQRHEGHARRGTQKRERTMLDDGESGLEEGELTEERGVDGAQPGGAGSGRERCWVTLQAMGCGLDMRNEFSRCEY